MFVSLEKLTKKKIVLFKYFKIHRTNYFVLFKMYNTKKQKKSILVVQISMLSMNKNDAYYLFKGLNFSHF